MGARLHPNSGALRIKHDASTDDCLIEIKSARKSYTLKSADLDELWVRAARQGKEPLFVVEFEHLGVTASITITKDVRRKSESV